MMSGSNRVFPHEGREFHIQVEDLGAGDTLEVRVYDQGAVKFVKRVSYGEAVAGAPSRELRARRAHHPAPQFSCEIYRFGYADKRVGRE